MAALLLSLAACGNEAALTGTGDTIGDGEPDTQEFLNSKEAETSDWWDPWNNGWREAPDFTKLTVLPDKNSGEALEIPHMWVTEHGAYFVEITNNMNNMGRDGFIGGMDDIHDIALLNIFDSATGQQMVLCNRLTCPHDSEDCMAFLPPEPPDPMDEWGFSRSFIRGGWGSSSVLFIDSGYIYALNGGRTFYRFNTDGTGRTEYMVLPDDYDYNWGRSWLMSGNLYMMVSKMVEMNSVYGSYMGSVPAILEVDYINRTTNVIWEGENDGDGHLNLDVLGLWGGQIYLMQVFYPEVDWNCPEDTQRYYDEQEIVISSYNPANSQLTEILNDISYGYTFNSWAITEEGDMLYHSRRDETVGRFNVRTGVKTILAENIGGQIWMGEERDGRLFLQREHLSDDPEASWLFNKSDLFFLELATGELTELTIKTKRNIGEDVPAYILWEEDGYFYLTISQDYEEVTENWGWGPQTWYQEIRTQLGRIPIADYWASNESALEELEWFDQDDWWEYYSEKMGWGSFGGGGGIIIDEEFTVTEVVPEISVARG